MGVQSWMVKSWPMAEWYLPDATARWPLLRHAQTQVRDGSDRPGRRFGETVWVGHVNGQSVGLAWEWVELRRGVVMLADPNSVITNIRFLTAERTYQEHAVAMVSLNRLTHHLPWQEAVCAVLDAQDRHSAGASVTPLFSGTFASSREGRHLGADSIRAVA